MNLDYLFIYKLFIIRNVLPFAVSVFTFGFFYLFIGILIKDQKAKIFNSIIALMITVSLYFATIFYLNLSRFDYFFDFVTLFLTRLLETSLPYTFISIVENKVSIYSLGILVGLVETFIAYLNVRKNINIKVILKVYLRNTKEYLKGINVRLNAYINKLKANMINIIIDRNIKNELCTFNC